MNQKQKIEAITDWIKGEEAQIVICERLIQKNEILGDTFAVNYFTQDVQKHLVNIAKFKTKLDEVLNEKT